MFYECIIIFFLPQPWLKFVFSFVLQTQWNTSQPEMGLFSTTVSNFFSHFSSKLNHWSLLSILLWTNFGRKIRKEICSSQFFLFFLAARKQFVFNSVNWLVTKIIPVLFFRRYFLSTKWNIGLWQWCSADWWWNSNLRFVLTTCSIMACKLKEKENTFYIWLPICCKCDTVT